MVGTDEGKGWVGKSDRGSDLKNAGYGNFNQNPTYMVFSAAADLIPTPPDRAAPLAAAVFLVANVELHPLGWVCSTSSALVDVERAPFPSGASRLSTVSFNTLKRSVRTLLAKNISQAPPPPPYRERICEYSVAEKTYGLGRAGDISDGV
jgi:hypothetical protein